MNSYLQEFFKTAVGIYQGSLLLPILFNLFLGKIMQETSYDHHRSTSISGRLICNLRFAEDIGPMDGSGGELQDLTNRLVDRATAHGIEVNTENSMIMATARTTSVQILA